MSSLRIDVTANVQGAVTGLDQVSKSTQRAGAAIERATNQTRKFGNQVTTAQSKFRKAAMGGVQQAGYQIGDFAVQVANGTSRIQAFGQQAPQFLQIFGPIGAAVGAAVAIIAAIATVAEKSRKAMKKEFSTMAEAASELNSAFSALESSDPSKIFESLAPRVQELKAQYSDLFDMMMKVAEQRRSEAIVNVIKLAGPDVGEVEKLRVGYEQLKLSIANTMEQTAASMLPIMQNAKRYQDELAKAAGTTELLNSLNASTREEAEAQLGYVVQELNQRGYMTDELMKQLDIYAQESGLAASIAAKTEEVVTSLQKNEGTRFSITSLVREEEKLMGLIVGKNADTLRLEGERVAQLSKIVAFNQILASVSSNAEDKLMSRPLAPYQQGIDNVKKILAENEAAAAEAKREAAAAASAAKKAANIGDPLGDMVAKIKIQRELIGASKAEQAVRMAIYDADRKYTPEQIANAISLVAAYEEQTTAMDAIKDRAKDVASAISSSMENAMMSMVDGTKSVKEAFKSMAAAIITDLYRIFVVKKITGMISGAIEGYMNPAVPATPAIAGARAMGGQVTGGKAYMVGERGPEMVVPSRNGHVVPNNQVGGGGVTIIQNNTFGNGVNRAEINAMLPKIVEASKAAVLDARRRGGSYAGAF
jgi:gas vesicle protein